MKYLKMLGLAAIAALGLMAFVGAGTASATTLCTSTKVVEDEGGVKTTVCNVKITTGTTIKASLKTGTSARLTSGGSTIATCSASSVKGKTTNESATWVAGNIEELTWPEASCSQTTHTVKFGKLTIMWTSATSGTVEADETEVTLELFGVTCTYGAGAGTHLGTITGGSAPILSISTTVNKTAGGFLCPGSAGWDAEYEVTEPHALFVVN